MKTLLENRTEKTRQQTAKINEPEKQPKPAEPEKKENPFNWA